MEDAATGEIRLSILWEWLHKHGKLTEDDDETGVRAGDTFTIELYERLHREEMEKLRRADNRDVYDDSKVTTLPIASAIVEAYITSGVKTPWYIDLLNLNIDNVDLAAAEERIQMYMRAFQNDGTRITENLDFA
jgi:malate synthase